MELEAILALYDEEQRINVEYPGVRKERLPHLIRFVDAVEGHHFILYSRLTGMDIEAVIADEQAYFSPLGEVEWKLFAHDQPPDLRERLVSHGFIAEEPEAIMVLDLEAMPPMPTSSRVQKDTASFDTQSTISANSGIAESSDGMTIRRLENASQLKDVRRIEEIVWEEEFEWVTQSLAADLEIPGYLSVYVAYIGGQPASAGWIRFHPKSQFASLWGGSTVPEHRGRGLYTALLSTRVQEANSRGYRFVTIDASPMSRPIVARHGFRLLTTAWPCKWKKGQ